LALASQDAELKRWLEEYTASQAMLRKKFKEIPVPEGLKEQILSERKAHVSLPVRRRLVLAAAAAMVLLVLAFITLPLLRGHEDKSFANFRTRMLRLVARQYPRMDLETDNQEQIRQYLAAHQAQSDYQLPDSLRKTPSTGCAILRWRDKPVSMICFNSGKNRNPTVPDLFLFVTDRANVPKAPAAGPAEFLETNRLATASWSTADKTYLLAGLGDEAFLRRYVQ
jgi:hypothetical protein